MEKKMEFIEHLLHCKSIPRVITICQEYRYDIFSNTDLNFSVDYQIYCQNLLDEGDLLSLRNMLNNTKNLGADYYIADLSLGALGDPKGYYNTEPRDLIEIIINNLDEDLYEMMDRFHIDQLA